MFVLTCPFCKTGIRVRVARLGARATCTACHQPFMLDSATVAIESDGAPSAQAPAPGPVAGLPSSSDLTFLAASPPAMAQPQVHQPPASDTLAQTTAPMEEASSGLVDSEDERIDMGQGGGVRRKGRRRRKSGVDPVMVLLGVAVLIGLVFVLVKLTEPAPVTVIQQDAGNPAPRKPKNSFTDAQDTTGKSNPGVASIGPENSSPRPMPPRPEVDPNPDPPDAPPMPVTPQPDDQPTGELFPEVGGVKSTKPKPVNGEPPPATLPVNRRDLPELKLTRSTDHAWQPLTAASPAITESPKIDGVAHWSASLHTVVEGSKTIVMGMIVPDSQQVWRSADVQVQIYGDKGLLSGTTTEVPFIVGRQETVVRLQIPQNLATQCTRVVATVQPKNKISGALHLEHDESFLRILDENSKPLAMEARLYNPHDKVIRDPEVVVEAVGEDGWPIGIYQGKLTGAVIEPGKGYEFYMAVPIQIKLPGQISIRAFGLDAKPAAGN